MACFNLLIENWISQQGKLFFLFFPLCYKIERNIFQSKKKKKRCLANNLLSKTVIFHPHTHTQSKMQNFHTRKGLCSPTHELPEGCFSDLVSWGSSGRMGSLPAQHPGRDAVGPWCPPAPSCSFETNPPILLPPAGLTPPCHPSLACPMPSG